MTDTTTRGSDEGVDVAALGADEGVDVAARGSEEGVDVVALGSYEGAIAALGADEGVDVVAEVTRYRAAQRPERAPVRELVSPAALGTDEPYALPSALAGNPPAAVTLPRGLWRVLPDRLLSLHPARRGEAVARLRITPAEHLALTALVLEQWGWAQAGDRIRTAGGRRCILGAQRVVFCLGYGTEDTATTAGDHINTVLRARGVALPYSRWNEQPHVSADHALTVLRAAAALAAGGGPTNGSIDRRTSLH